MSSGIRSNLKVALAIKAARALLGMSLRDIGAYCDVSPVTVGKWESGDLPIKISVFLKLLKLFNENGIDVDVTTDDDLHITLDSSGLDKLCKFYEHRAMLKSGEMADDSVVGVDSFVVSPQIKRRKKRTESESGESETSSLQVKKE